LGVGYKHLQQVSGQMKSWVHVEGVTVGWRDKESQQSTGYKDSQFDGGYKESQLSVEYRESKQGATYKDSQQSAG
jgi:hypothetical protein